MFTSAASFVGFIITQSHSRAVLKMHPTKQVYFCLALRFSSAHLSRYVSTSEGACREKTVDIATDAVTQIEH